MDATTGNMLRESVESIAETQAQIHKDLVEIKGALVQQSNHTFSVVSQLADLNRNMSELIVVVRKLNVR